VRKRSCSCRKGKGPRFDFDESPPERADRCVKLSRFGIFEIEKKRPIHGRRCSSKSHGQRRPQRRCHRRQGPPRSRKVLQRDPPVPSAPALFRYRNVEGFRVVAQADARTANRSNSAMNTATAGFAPTRQTGQNTLAPHFPRSPALPPRPRRYVLRRSRWHRPADRPDERATGNPGCARARSPAARTPTRGRGRPLQSYAWRTPEQPTIVINSTVLTRGINCD